MERDNALVIKADARAMSAVTALDTRASERWKGSGTKSGVCVSILPDGTRLPFSVTRSRKESAPRKNVARVDTRTAYEHRLSMFGAIDTGN